VIIVYEAANSIEANLLKDIFAQEGIDAVIHGEYLQGGIGELPAIGLVQLIVADEDQLRAAAIIHKWEQGAYTL